MLHENRARLFDWVAGDAGRVAIPGSLAQTLGGNCKETELNVRKMTTIVLAVVTLILGACSTPTPTPEVLADCFLTFQVAAWQDLDGNGLWDASEPPLEGVEFRLQGTVAQMWGEPYLSDADGELTISTWSPGSCADQNYTITALPVESYEPTTPVSVTFSLGAGDFSYERQFGFHAVTE